MARDKVSTQKPQNDLVMNYKVGKSVKPDHGGSMLSHILYCPKIFRSEDNYHSSSGLKIRLIQTYAL